MISSNVPQDSNRAASVESRRQEKNTAMLILDKKRELSQRSFGLIGGGSRANISSICHFDEISIGEDYRKAEYRV